MNETKEKTSVMHRVLTVVGIIMCIILIPVLVINCTLLIRGYMNESEVPTVGGYAPMIVLTNSMANTFNGGDLIFIKSESPENVEVNDVIAFFDPQGNGSSVVSHRVLEVTEKDGEIAFRTKGDANTAEDLALVPADNLIGVYTGFYIAGAGSVAMFMQTTTGLVVCVILPILLLVGYDVLRRRRYEKKHAEDKEALLAELEELRKLKAEKKAE